MSTLYGRPLLLATFVTFAACGDDAHAPADPGSGPDAGSQLPPDAGMTDPGADASIDAGPGGGADASVDAGPGGGADASVDAGPDGGSGGSADPAIGHWRTDFVLPGLAGDGARVEAIALADGGAKAYVGGIFSDAAGVPAKNVALWTGADWQPLGAGLDGWVRALRLDDLGGVWAGVTGGGGGTVQRWDGTAWTLMGAADDQILDLAIAGDRVAVVGRFTAIDGVAAPGFAYHDAAGWHATGAGTDGSVTAVTQNGPSFCVAGSFSTIDGVTAENAACWDGSVWSPLGAGLPGGVAVLARSPAGSWYAGGTLTYADPSNGDVIGAGIAVLSDGQWQLLGGGIDDGFINEVRGIAFAGDDVLIGGCFQTAAGHSVLARFLARWSPATGWSELAGGLVSDVGVFLPSIEGGNDLAVAADGSIWIGGLYTRAGGGAAVNIARMPAGGAPQALVGGHPTLGVAGFVDGLAATGDGALLVGGDFAFAGQAPTTGFARFDGTGWTDLGNGLSGVVRDLRVRGDGSIAVAGELVYQGERIAFAQSSGGAWTLHGGAVHGAGSVITEQDGVLWLGGSLTDTGLTALHNLARLDGDVWSAAGDFDDAVTALTVHGGAIVAGGLFHTVDGAAITALAQLDRAGWVAIGGGLTGSYVNVVASSPVLGLVVGGAFAQAGEVTTQGLARWDGEGWHDLGGGISAPFDVGQATALLPYEAGVFVAGVFDTAGGVAAQSLAWFDGAAWHELGGGLSDLAESMVVIDHVLYAGGPFTSAGGRTSSGLAAWDFRAK